MLLKDLRETSSTKLDENGNIKEQVTTSVLTQYGDHTEQEQTERMLADLHVDLLMILYRCEIKLH